MKSKYLSSVIILSSGSLIAQIVAILCAPLLTRLYSPESFGTFTYIVSLCSIFYGVINARYDATIVTDPQEKNVFPLFKLSILCGLFLTIIATAICFYLTHRKGLSAAFVFYIFFTLLSYAILNPITAYNNREKEYKTISITYTIRKIVQDVGGLCGSLITRSFHGLIIPYVIGQYLGINAQAKHIKPHAKEIISIPWSEVKRVASIHRNQPLFSTPAILANSLSYSLITIIITQIYGMETVGYYSISVQLLGLPLAVIGANISKVFVERASKEYARIGNFAASFNKTFLLLLIIAFPLTLLIWWLSPWACGFFLGEGWEISGGYIRVLAPMFGVRFITSALSPALIIVNKQKIELILQCIFILSNFISMIVAKRLNLDITGFLMIINWLFFLSYCCYLSLIWRFSKGNASVHTH